MKKQGRIAITILQLKTVINHIMPFSHFTIHLKNRKMFKNVSSLNIISQEIKIVVL